MREEERDRLLEWLLAHGGPVVRYRTAAELWPDCPPVELHRIAQDLLACPQVQHWLDHLTLGSFTGSLDHLDSASLSRLAPLVHGSKAHALENVLGRLNEMGLRAGMPSLDERLLPAMRIFHAKDGWQADDVYCILLGSLIKSIFAWGLLRCGYFPDPAMQTYLFALVESTHRIAREEIYDFYASEEEKKGLPKIWQDKPVIKQEIAVNYHLPSIHDLYVLAYLPAWLLDEETAGMIQDIASYVLNARLQQVYPGYGYAWSRERRTCYSWGWSPHLTGYHGFEWKNKNEAATLVQQVELMARFPVAHATRWFQSALRHLEWFRTESGTYRFPPHYLRDLPDGYYVNGAGLGLCENRRAGRGTVNWLEIESTFHMLKIRLALPGEYDTILL